MQYNIYMEFGESVSNSRISLLQSLFNSQLMESLKMLISNENSLKWQNTHLCPFCHDIEQQYDM